MKPKYLGTGFCRYCEQDVDVFEVDEGIGSYEYAGAPGWHHDYRAVCCQCGEDVDGYEHDAPFYYQTHKHPRL